MSILLAIFLSLGITYPHRDLNRDPAVAFHRIVLDLRRELVGFLCALAHELEHALAAHVTKGQP